VLGYRGIGILLKHAPFNGLSLLVGKFVERYLHVRGGLTLDELELIVLHADPLHAKTPTRLISHPAATCRVQEQVGCDAQQPHDGLPSLRIELLATLKRPCECLGDKIEYQIRSCSCTPAQIGANQRISAFVQRPEILRAPTRQQLLVARLDRHAHVYTGWPTHL
jgi:hypothetical protein